MEISVGQEVRFVNDAEIPFWPASNIHPTHEIYRDFDPKRPVLPGEAWDFTFERPGFWRYHNHLDPSQSGLVVVSGESGARDVEPLVVTPQELSFKEPGVVSVEDTINLFSDDDLLARYVKEYGPGLAPLFVPVVVLVSWVIEPLLWPLGQRPPGRGCPGRCGGVRRCSVGATPLFSPERPPKTRTNFR